MEKCILEVVHSAAQDLHEVGIVDKKTMREFDELCLPKLHHFAPEQIKQIRLKNHMSQGIFAACLNASEATVRAWEQGQKHPSGPSLKLLNLVADKGVAILL